MQLPSVCKGGEFIVRYNNEEVCYNFRKGTESSPYTLYFCCHHSDCEHEVRLDTPGDSLALVYNLFWGGPGRTPCAEFQKSAVGALADELQRKTMAQLSKAPAAREI